MEQTVTQQQPSTGKGKKILFIGLGIAATGTLGYFGYNWWRNRQQTTTEDTNIPDTAVAASSRNKNFLPTAPAKRNDEFPLHKGSKGTRVTQLQEALIEKYGNEILPKHGADGDFGSELAAALAKENYPASIDESTFNVLVQGGGLDAEGTSKDLYMAAVKKDFSAVLKSLQKLKSKEDYSAVSEIFKNNYRIGGVRQTLVNGMLSSFTDDKQQQAIRLQFTRMGLNYDGKKWSLSGVDAASIITTTATLVWVNPTTAICVPANLILGREVVQKGKYTVFENTDRQFLVTTATIARIA